ncbi:MAG: hypothetical protein AMXMBFR59_22510 [Rhodanobacteraceae bacterium]
MRQRFQSHRDTRTATAVTPRRGWYFIHRRALALLVLLLTLLGGCSQAIRGGAPTTLNAPSSVAPGAPDPLPVAAQELVDAGSVAARNQVLQRRLIMIDAAYGEFISTLRRQKTMTDLATSLAGLAIGVAGTLTDGAAAKTHYAAAGTLLTGGAAVVDQTLYYEQTVIALVAAMDANRAAVRVNILKGMNQDLANYAPDDAYADLQTYERAGTLLAAIGYIQATAKQAKDAADEDIRNIVALTPAQYDAKVCNTRSLFKANPKRTAANLMNAATTLGLSVAPADQANANAIAAQISQLNRDADTDGISRIAAALSSAGVLIDCTQ